MSTVNYNAQLINLDEITTSSQILMAAEDSDVLRFTTANNSQERALSIQHASYGEVNYERKSDWMRLVNKLNEHDDTPIKRMITGNKRKLDWGAIKLSRIDIEYSDDGILVEFKEPAKMLVETIGDKAVVIEVNKLKGKITWEWYHSGADVDNDLGGYANFLEIFLYEIEIVE